MPPAPRVVIVPRYKGKLALRLAGGLDVPTEWNIDILGPLLRGLNGIPGLRVDTHFPAFLVDGDHPLGELVGIEVADVNRGEDWARAHVVGVPAGSPASIESMPANMDLAIRVLSAVDEGGEPLVPQPPP